MGRKKWRNLMRKDSDVCADDNGNFVGLLFSCVSGVGAQTAQSQTVRKMNLTGENSQSETGIHHSKPAGQCAV